MKPEIHPTYFPKAKVACACGNSFVAGSTLEEVHIDVCDNCHPFFTGKQKLVDTAGRVDKFKQKTAAQEKLTHTSKKVKKAAQKAKKVAKQAEK